MSLKDSNWCGCNKGTRQKKNWNFINNLHHDLERILHLSFIDKNDDGETDGVGDSASNN